MRPNTIVIGLKLSPEERQSRITARVGEMLKYGLEKEVTNLAAKYGWGVEPMKGIGYREFKDYFEGTQSLEQTRDRIISATTGLAKRQRTWFKRNNSIHWVSKQVEAVDLLTTVLNK
jgi:tRNA dimethylallyltransferase